MDHQPPTRVLAPQLAVSGRVANNSALMPNATLGYPCSAVYVIDTVLLPAAHAGGHPALLSNPCAVTIDAQRQLWPGRHRDCLKRPYMRASCS